MADGNFIYLIAISDGDTAHITKISTDHLADRQPVPHKPGRQLPPGGCYDPVNDCFWLGALQANMIYQYYG